MYITSILCVYYRKKFTAFHTNLKKIKNPPNLDFKGFWRVYYYLFVFLKQRRKRLIFQGLKAVLYITRILH